jgi:hypothetical protein
MDCVIDAVDITPQLGDVQELGRALASYSAEMFLNETEAKVS